jgi:hypothetical protein
MEELGLRDSCFDIANFDPEVLFQAFGSIVSNSNEIKRRMAVVLQANRALVGQQFDQLYPSPVRVIPTPEAVR